MAELMIKSSKIKTSCLEEINISKEVNALSKRVDEVVIWVKNYISY